MTTMTAEKKEIYRRVNLLPDDMAPTVLQFLNDLIGELEPDPFYSEANLMRLRKAIADIEAGKVTAHELIEVDDE